MLIETMLENAKKLNASIERDLNRIKLNIENSKQPSTEWNIYSPDIRQSKLTEQIDRVMARSVNELNRLEEDINIEIETIRVKCEDTLQPLLRSKEIDKERSGQWWSDTAFKFVSMASISEVEAEYKKALIDNRTDYCTGLIKWSALKFKADERYQINTIKKEYSKLLGVDEFLKAIKILEITSEQVQNFSHHAVGERPNLLNLIHEKRLPQIKQELLSSDITPIW